MTIEIKRNAEETIIKLVGRLDTTTAPALDKTINEDIAGTNNLVLDVKGQHIAFSQHLVALALFAVELDALFADIHIHHRLGHSLKMLLHKLLGQNHQRGHCRHK